MRVAFGFAGLAGAFAACSLATAAHAVPILDQASIPETGAIPLPNEGFGPGGIAVLSQTFTAGLSGTLTRIDLALVGSPFERADGGFTVSLRTPASVELFSAYLDYSTPPNVFGASWTDIPSFDLSAAAIAVAVGQQFWIVVSADAVQDPSGVSWLHGAGGAPLSYAGGAGYVSFFGGPPTATGRDMGFRTYVDTAVPEPATWALMLAGFGLAGGALRRRRIAPA